MTSVFRSGAKTGAEDARIIAETARMRTDLTEITTSGELVVDWVARFCTPEEIRVAGPDGLAGYLTDHGA